VAGYVNHLDKPDTVYALKNHYVLGAQKEVDAQMKQQVTNFLKSIDTPDET